MSLLLIHGRQLEGEMIDNRVHPIMVACDSLNVNLDVERRRFAFMRENAHEHLVFIGGHYDTAEYMDTVGARLLREENNLIYGTGSGPIEKEKPAENSLVMRLLSRI